ncbi:MAG: Ig-like domain-containing protein [Acidobacteriota bacterium]|nr:Ig-like domain-containing protein [Acidobacteriota bacterium]
MLTGPGTANISATSGTVTGSTGFTVTAASLVSIVITPPAASIPLGATQQFTATGTYTDGTTQNVTSSGHWSSIAANVATISNSTPTAGLATTFAAGTTNIGIALGSVNASATLAVSPAALASIVISPQSPSIALGATQDFIAAGTYTDGTTQDVTSLVTWNSSSSPVAIISNAAGNNRLATSAGVGATTITPTLGSISASTTLAVGQASLVSIAVTPANVSMPLGSSQQFAAVATYSDGSLQDVTALATWTSAMSSLASVSNAPGSNGLATGTGLGSVTITANLGSTSAFGVLTITPASALTITLTPALASIAAGATQQSRLSLFIAMGPCRMLLSLRPGHPLRPQLQA